MVVDTKKLQTRIKKDKTFLSDFNKGLKDKKKELEGQGLSSTDVRSRLQERLKTGLGEGGISAVKGALADKSQKVTDTRNTRALIDAERERLGRVTTVEEEAKLKAGGQLDTGIPPLEEKGITPERVETPEQKTLREQVSGIIAGKQTREEQLTSARDEFGRTEQETLRKGFTEQATAVQEDLQGIIDGLEAEGGAITRVAASRIREARSAPLREQLASFVKGIELTGDNIAQIDQSVDAILKARTLDRQEQTTSISNRIEASSLSAEEKNKLQTELGIRTDRMTKEDELEAFKQKEQFKSDLELQEKNAVAQTGLNLAQNVTLGKVINNFDVKEDSLVAKSVASMLKEGKTEQEINKILGLATDSEGNFVDDTQFARREKLRKEFEAKAGVKAFREAVVQHQGTIATLGQASGPGDVAAVFQFMKTLDPTSVVRESEFDAAANAAGVTMKPGILFEKFKSGAILGEQDSKVRESFVKTVNKLFEVKKKNYDGLARQMIQQALRDGVDPKSVVLDLDEVPGASNLTGQDFNLLQDDDILEIDSEFGFTTSDGKTFNLDLTAFNTPDITGQPNAAFIGPRRVSIKNIGNSVVTQNFGATSPLKIDNVRLANGKVGTPGIDIDGKIGDNIPSTVSGKVKVIKSNKGLGNRVIVTDSKGNQHMFNHLNGFNVKDGDRISEGEILGQMGNSGSVIPGAGGDGSHLDYRVKSNKGWIDPNMFLKLNA